MPEQIIKRAGMALVCFALVLCSKAQENTDTTTVTTKEPRPYKNIIRYNLSGALIFGMDKFVVFGYERVIKPHQTASINFGKASLPKLISISTDSFQIDKDTKNTGVNFSIDYRFYLQHENKFMAPHGLYIGPYYSFNKFDRDVQWNDKRAGHTDFINTKSELIINTVGFELGYQFILWKRVSLDFLMVGPGIGFYSYHATFDSNLSADTKQQLLKGLDQLLKQKFPGFNYVFSDKEINGNGSLNATSIGYRYLVQVGFNF